MYLDDDRKVLPNYTTKNCRTLWCSTCNKIFSFWLDEECEEREVDWDYVPIDTLVKVKDNTDIEWSLQYFKEISNKLPTHRYVTWADGTTSKTSNGAIKHWKYCELAEEV